MNCMQKDDEVNIVELDDSELANEVTQVTEQNDFVITGRLRRRASERATPLIELKWCV